MKFRFFGRNSEHAQKGGFGVSLIGWTAAAFMLAGFFYLYSARETVPAEEDVKSAFVLTEASRELTIPEIVKKAKPSVVGISSRFGESVGTGTGIIMSADGYIVTNAHVVKNSSETAESVTVVLSDKSEYPAEIIGADSPTDLAVVKIDAEGISLPAAEFGDSRVLSEGELAVAIGNPLGFELYGSVTSGIISALNRTVTVDEYTMTLIQTDAAINPGNSGGPLLNSCGQVIGINSSKIISDSAEGLGFAIPITSAKPIIDELIKNGFISGRPRIGISGEDVDEETAVYYDMPQGVYVRFVEKNSAADTAGIRPGDIIVSADGKPVKTMRELNAVKDGFKSGEELAVTVYRAKSRIEIKIILGSES
ncbi:MAG: trypsin-like peptidase domain-containing protein [Ruminococcus sp.]|nr:trypsin-like peptidase domain-containing protein [Ruminococcus sp.]MCM1381562.1 trypsin-like peptidase domain-containing protein [Muribaculaceae bacterium]MCM1479935.1 trypsin-like peptidase domain-containing protein [Muribaculaceae bacterium]